jgi:hypothetical protein
MQPEILPGWKPQLACSPLLKKTGGFTSNPSGGFENEAIYS